MFNKPKNSTRRPEKRFNFTALPLLVVPICFLVVLWNSLGYVFRTPIEPPDNISQNTNQGIKEQVIDYLTINGAEELIPIIGCESEFKHFNEDGTVLKNRQGSSATGVAQIMASVHPDPHVIKKYNRRHNTDWEVNDFDINSLGGNIWYALVLYKTRGVRDWECAGLI